MNTSTPSAAPRACAECGYDLRGTPASAGSRCPECGQPLATPEMDLARERGFFKRVRRLAVFLLVAVAGASALTMALPDHRLVLAPLLVFLLAPMIPLGLAAYCARQIGD